MNCFVTISLSQKSRPHKGLYRCYGSILGFVYNMTNAACCQPIPLPLTLAPPPTSSTYRLTLPKTPPLLYRNTPSFYRNTLSLYRNTPSFYRNTLSLYRNTPSFYRNTLSLYRNTPSFYRNTLSLYRNTPSLYRN